MLSSPISFGSKNRCRGLNIVINCFVLNCVFANCFSITKCTGIEMIREKPGAYVYAYASVYLCCEVNIDLYYQLDVTLVIGTWSHSGSLLDIHMLYCFQNVNSSLVVPVVAVLIVIIVISLSVRALHKEAVSWGTSSHCFVCFVSLFIHRKLDMES